MILSLKILIKIKGPGPLSPYDSAIDCCKSKAVPKVCLGMCLPRGAVPTRRKKKGLKCSKHVITVNTCKKGRSYLINVSKIAKL